MKNCTCYTDSDGHSFTEPHYMHTVTGSVDTVSNWECEDDFAQCVKEKFLVPVIFKNGEWVEN